MLRFHVISAVFKRNVQHYFSGILGYLFIVVFVTVGAFLAFDEEFFANNLANLDQLSARFPMLLLFLVPAITMGVWADEKKLGTDELLFTLPARDVEILLGKYFAVLTVYSIALLFSVTHLFMLAWIGDPDWGQVFATYTGYWLAGAALLSAGMFASVLTGSTTVAFVVGAAVCAVPVFIDAMPWSNEFFRDLSLAAQLQDFVTGLIPLTGVLYFVSFTCFMLYLNLVFITSRHWSSGQQNLMGLQFAARAVSLAAILVAFCFMAEKSGTLADTDVDLTAENLFTLSDTTHRLLEKAAEDERQITIQAFLSPNVPRKYVHVRKRLVGLLAQYDRLGGGWIDVRFIDVAPNSKDVDDARSFGIEPRHVKTERNGRTIEEDVYLGVVISSNLDEVVIPFIDATAAMEYELTRSLGTVISKRRITVGVLLTDAHFFGFEGEWQFWKQMMDELKKQFTIVEVTPDDLREFVDQDRDKERKKKSKGKNDSQKDDENKSEPDDTKPKKTKPDVVIAVSPSSLTSTQMMSFVAYVERGNPVLIFDDPLPFYPVTYLRPRDGVLNAPRQQRPLPDSGLGWLSTAPRFPSPPPPPHIMRMPPQFRQTMLERYYREHPEARPRFIPKSRNGTAESLMNALGISWNNGQVVWDLFDPHPDFAPKWPNENFVAPRDRKFYGPRENLFLFVGPGSGNTKAFSSNSPITAGLQEMLLFYAGTIERRSGAKTTFEPLIESGTQSGVISWDELTETPQVPFSQRDRFTGDVHTTIEKQRSGLSGHVVDRLVSRPPQRYDSRTHVLAAHVTAKKGKNDATADIDAVFVADTDLLSNLYFDQQKAFDRPLDNVVFVYNAIEVLAGDDSFAALRSRRPRPRTLTEVRARTDKFRKLRRTKQQEAEKRLDEALKAARERLKTKKEKISQDEGLGIFQKAQSLAMTAQTEQQRFNNEKKKLDRDLEQTIDKLKATEQRQIRQYENRVRLFAVVIPPVPAILLGLIVLLIRQYNERRNITASRRA
ncbi:MAG: Gldg family protein [Planctomycetes bacterium]|nr:Gldg family protein [Planctomycetota bacterium]